SLDRAPSPTAPLPPEAPALKGAGESPLLLPLAEVERQHILRVLEAVKGNRTAAARTLEIGRNTLARKLKEYGLADEG
ncbi:helix-turn-helix domain-containing protein, partial [Corallococcus sp. CA053C]|uniref:helix-turn-helix domain-containing protein n=1 Tax=Corallococcus sp. CA053C TaxID=2316732 RepID=UPI002729F55D